LNLAKLANVTDLLALEPLAEVGGVLVVLAIDAALEVDDAGEGLLSSEGGKKEKNVNFRR
jgi:hypothetical protein